MTQEVSPIGIYEKDQIIEALRQELAEKDQQLQQSQQREQEKDQRIQQLENYQDKMHEVLTNKDMTYSDRVLWMITLKNHPHEILTLKPFQPNVSRLRQESGVSPDSATKFFAAMQEANGIKYSNKRQQDEEQNFSSVSTVIPQANHSQANTKAATLRIKQRMEVSKRRMARKLIPQPCEQCGSENTEHAYSAIIPICKNCNHVSMDRQETVLTRNVRIVEEDKPMISTPSHEFSEVTDHEWEESSEEISETPSHEFSEAPAEPEETPATKTPGHEFSEPSTAEEPSHEFSEGMTVNTPYGIGIISRISFILNNWRYHIRYSTPQDERGTYYRTFNFEDIQPVRQTALLS